MKKIIWFVILILLIIIGISSCEDKNNNNNDNVIIEDIDSAKSEVKNNKIEKNYSFEDKGNRLLGIGVNEGNIGFEKAFNKAKETNFNVIELAQQWDELETEKEVYTNFYLDIANDYYPNHNIKISLNLNPIDTTNLRIPKDLKDKKLNDKETIERFKKVIDYLMLKTDKLEIVSLAIGNEIDVYLGNNKDKWEEYILFYKEITEYIHNKYPEVKVGTKITFESLNKNLKEESKNINQYSDIILTTYYPIKNNKVENTIIVHEAFEEIVELYPNKKIYFAEIGYPSSEYLDSSQLKQADFIRESFKAWDIHKEQILLLNFIWLHDISSEELKHYEKYYGLGSKGFLEYLGTLGFRTYNGKDKLAFVALKEETELRNWD